MPERLTARTLVAIVSLCWPALARAAIEVNVTHVGFPGVSGGDVIRAGSWVPIIIDVALANEQAFDGVIRVAQPDSDGDECFDEVPLHLRSDQEGGRRVYLYVPANPVRTNERFVVEVRSEQGEAVRMVSQGELTFQAAPGQQPNVIAEDDTLVLLVSSTTLGRFSEAAGRDFADRFMHGVSVAHTSPGDLPELWIGLDSVDIVIWDDARPEELTSRQLASLLEWVRQGGTVLIAASRSAGALKLSKLVDSILPVELGEIVAVENLPEVRAAVLDEPKEAADFAPRTAWNMEPFPAPVPIARATKRGKARVIAHESSLDCDLFVRGSLGSGQVIFAGVSLHDLFTAPGGLVKFFTHVLQVRPSDRADSARLAALSLHEHVVSAVAFTTSSSLYLLAAGVFSIAYALAATFGTWKILLSRGWQHHSWSAFALVAVVASAASLMMVGWMHGFGDRLHQVSVVDADAGETHGHATGFFGLKTSIDKELDVWLPSDRVGADEPQAGTCFLRPLPEGSQPTESVSFADPDAYRLAPASAVIDDVRIRATLKRFEGRWDGPLGGKFHGRIAAKGRMITDDSYLVNELGVDLSNCHLLQPISNIGDMAVGRDQFIYAYPIGDLPSGEKIPIAQRCYPLGRPARDIMKANELEDAQRAWSARFQGILSSVAYGRSSQGGFAMGNEREALLLASTLGEFDPDTIAQTSVDWGAPNTWSRDRLRRLDLRLHLHAGDDDPPEAGTAVLIGFAQTPGPMRLFTRTGERDFRPLQPEADSSWTMYRIRIPMTRLAGGAESEEDAEIRRGMP